MIVTIDLHPIVLNNAIRLYGARWRGAATVDAVIAEAICLGFREWVDEEAAKHNQIEDGG